MKVSYSQEAIADLIRLREFIAIKNPQAAQKVATSIRKGISQLKTFPYLGIEVEQGRSTTPGLTTMETQVLVKW